MLDLVYLDSPRSPRSHLFISCDFCSYLESCYSYRCINRYLETNEPSGYGHSHWVMHTESSHALSIGAASERLVRRNAEFANSALMREIDLLARVSPLFFYSAIRGLKLRPESLNVRDESTEGI